jgi:hypothetical protein
METSVLREREHVTSNETTYWVFKSCLGSCDEETLCQFNFDFRALLLCLP